MSLNKNVLTSSALLFATPCLSPIRHFTVAVFIILNLCLLAGSVGHIQWSLDISKNRNTTSRPRCGSEREGLSPPSGGRDFLQLL
jgi:hypothetical protein